MTAEADLFMVASLGSSAEAVECKRLLSPSSVAWQEARLHQDPFSNCATRSRSEADFGL